MMEYDDDDDDEATDVVFVALFLNEKYVLDEDDGIWDIEERFDIEGDLTEDWDSTVSLVVRSRGHDSLWAAVPMDEFLPEVQRLN